MTALLVLSGATQVGAQSVETKAICLPAQSVPPPRDPAQPDGCAATSNHTMLSGAQMLGPSRKVKTVGQSLTVSGNLAAGYDDNAGSQSGSVGAGGVAPTAGTTGLADVMVEYLRKAPRRYIGIRTLGSVVMYPDYLEKPAPGMKARVFGSTQLGRSNTLEASTQVRYEPLFTAVQDPISVGGTADVMATEVVAGVPATGLFERRSWVSSNKAYLTRDWTRSDRTVVSYLYFVQQFVDHSGDNRYHQAAAQYSHRVGRRTDIGVGYSYQNGHSTDQSGIAYPSTHEIVSGQLTSSKLLGGRRQLSFSSAVGATRVSGIDTQTRRPFGRWAPSGSIGAAVDLTRRWKLEGGYRRDYSVLQGVGGQIYATDSVFLGATSRLSSRVEVGVSGNVGQGRTLVGLLTSDTFKLYGTAVDAHIALTSTLATVVSFTNYSQRFSNPALLPLGFPPRYDRKAITFGLTFSSSGQMRGPTDW